LAKCTGIVLVNRAFVSLFGDNIILREAVTMAAGKKTARREWTRSDIRELKSMTKTVLARQIARRLRRSEGAVRQKAFVLGTSLTVRTTPPWHVRARIELFAERESPSISAVTRLALWVCRVMLPAGHPSSGIQPKPTAARVRPHRQSPLASGQSRSGGTPHRTQYRARYVRYVGPEQYSGAGGTSGPE
jgi:hypothetical protein